MSSATLIFPHQLFTPHPAIAPVRPVYLAEDPLLFGNDHAYPVKFHKQKLVLHRASMRAYPDKLISNGHNVVHIDHTSSYADELPSSIASLHLADPSDFILEKRLRQFAESRSITLTIHPSPSFLSPPEFLETHIADRKRPLMAKLYQAQRKRLDILVDPDGQPTGGRWSYDDLNWKKLPNNFTPPSAPSTPSSHHVAEAIDYVNRSFPSNPGATNHFRIAAALDPSLDIPLNSLEGFIRQIIGWREFMHGIYRHRGVEIRNSNHFSHTRQIPDSFYTGTTGIPPVDRVIRQLLDQAYCHHIERLMILGNFMLLCSFNPQEVYKWFMEIFIDSYDWVMVPNVYGMSQFADGGTFTTKPYISGSSYILKMSDEKKGPWTDIWDALYWTFIADHYRLFLANPRSSMMARTWHRFSPGKQHALRPEAARFLATLDP